MIYFNYFILRVQLLMSPNCFVWFCKQLINIFYTFKFTVLLNLGFKVAFRSLISKLCCSLKFSCFRYSKILNLEKLKPPISLKEKKYIKKCCLIDLLLKPNWNLSRSIYFQIAIFSKQYQFDLLSINIYSNALKVLRMAWYMMINFHKRF